jgi:hypothetical protein
MLIKKCFLCACLAATAGAQLPLKDPTLDQVVMVVDGKNITRADIERIVATAPPAFQQMFQRDPVSAVMQYHIMLHLGQEGEKRQLDKKSPWKEQLEAARLDMLARALVNDEQNAYPVSNEMIEAYYQEHRSDYEQATMQAIFISFKPANAPATGGDVQTLAQEALGAARSTRTEAEARALAGTIVKRARGGENFVLLVEEFSEDLPSKRDRGNFGVLKAGTSHPEDFRKAVMAVGAGEISDPIRQATGFYVIRVAERSLQPVGEVRANIVKTIRDDHMNQWFSELNRRFQPQVTDPSALMTPPPQQTPGGVQVPGGR